MGVVASLVLAAVLIVVVLRMRGRGESNDEKSEEGSRRDKNATISAAKADAEQGGPGAGAGLGDENNPDLIPDKSGESSRNKILVFSLNFCFFLVFVCFTFALLSLFFFS